MPYKAHLIYDGFRMFRSTSVLMSKLTDKLFRKLGRQAAPGKTQKQAK